MNAAELEAPHPLEAAGDADSITVSWADRERDAYGFARLGRGLGADGTHTASALAVVYARRAPAGVLAEGGVPVAPDEGWEAVSAGGLHTGIRTPLASWTLASEGELALELAVEATSDPVPVDPDGAFAAAGGMAGYEQLCSVRGTVAGAPVAGIGQRSRSWGNPDWDAIALTRAVGVWLSEGRGLVLAGVRPVGARSHAEEAVWGALLGPGASAELTAPRLSTTSDADGRQRRAGLELPPADEEGRTRWIAGEVLTGSTLDLGALRLDCAFFQWHADGELGIGHYDVLRRAA